MLAIQMYCTIYLQVNAGTLLIPSCITPDIPARPRLSSSHNTHKLHLLLLGDGTISLIGQPIFFFGLESLLCLWDGWAQSTAAYIVICEEFEPFEKALLLIKET